jgi:D-lactate dehydrogenase
LSRALSSAIGRLAGDPARIAPDVDCEPWPDRAPDWVADGTPEPLRSQLTGALGDDRVLTRALDLVRYASDASPYRRIPKAVAMPRDIDDVVKLVKLARGHAVPLVFRGGGTSLNGQSQTDSVLVDARRHWQRARVLEGGEAVRAQPGIVLGHVNRMLARHGRRLGPDPASTNIACVGGVIANNAGGMRCGVLADSYRTVRSMTLVLANSAVIDTAAPDAGEGFAAAAPELARGLEQIRDELRSDRVLAERVARKFEIKNTMGYRLCAFLDADEPVEIFRRLVIGSEGTLAFVAEAVLQTVPFGRHATVSLALFPDIDEAAGAVDELVRCGASATELMIAPTLIAASYNMPGTPERWRTLPPESAALLIEFRDADPGELHDPEARALEILRSRTLLDEPRFSRDPEEIEMLWRVREGMQGLIAAMRPAGVSLIIEDVCVPPARLAGAARDLQALLRKHGFLPGLAGHASAGNLHFLLTPNFAEQADLERYDAFMHEAAELIVGKYDGSLKAEHGTGVNMAPFVAREWGAKATELMWRVKQLADPDGIFGPGIVLNRDPRAHLHDLKSTPQIEEVATKCIECGFCEPVCPSRNVTTTPRQRIVLRREMVRQPPGSPVRGALLAQYGYDAIDTCAADGSCMDACPVSIDTGKLIKELRHRRHTERVESVAGKLASHYGTAERLGRVGLRSAGPALRMLRDTVPRAAPELPFTVPEGAAAVYMPSCINRIIGNSPPRSTRPSVAQALVALSLRAGLPLWIPEDVTGHCCGMPWSSKGLRRGHEAMAAKTAEALRRWSDHGRLPVVVDASSCTHGLLEDEPPAGVEVLDSIAWVHDHLLERLEISDKLSSVVVHPTCSVRHLGLTAKLSAIASRIAHEVVVPAGAGCCGMAGDRGLVRPELLRSALRDMICELEGREFDACLSSNRTCEIGMQQTTGRPYESFLISLEELTRV